jgi:N-acyl-D-aspartate/D-glutamate deacylase
MEPAAAVMRGKGRLQVGCDADMVAFSLDQVRDRATYAEPGLPSAGMRHVLVAGVPVVRDGILDRDTRPGRWIRSC